MSTLSPLDALRFRELQGACQLLFPLYGAPGTWGWASSAQRKQGQNVVNRCCHMQIAAPVARGHLCPPRGQPRRACTDGCLLGGRVPRQRAQTAATLPWALGCATRPAPPPRPLPHGCPREPHAEELRNGPSWKREKGQRERASVSEPPGLCSQRGHQGPWAGAGPGG